MFGAGEGVGKPNGSASGSCEPKIVGVGDCQVDGRDDIECTFRIEQANESGDWIRSEGRAKCEQVDVDHKSDTYTYDCEFREVYTPESSSREARLAKWAFGSGSILDDVEISEDTIWEAKDLQVGKVRYASRMIGNALRHSDRYHVSDNMDSDCRQGSFIVRSGSESVKIFKRGAKYFVETQRGNVYHNVHAIKRTQFNRLTKRIQFWRDMQ